MLWEQTHEIRKEEYNRDSWLLSVDVRFAQSQSDVVQLFTDELFEELISLVDVYKLQKKFTKFRCCTAVCR